MRVNNQPFTFSRNFVILNPHKRVSQDSSPCYYLKVRVKGEERRMRIKGEGKEGKGREGKGRERKERERKGREEKGKPIIMGVPCVLK